MNVLVVGSGGREHTLAWKLAQSPRVARVIVAPGNGGTAGSDESGPIANAAVSEGDFPGLLDLCRRESVELVVVGPEVPLTDGIVDAFAEAGVPCFGPGREAARLEGEKSFAKAFMDRHGIPTARWRVFHSFDAACAHLDAVDYPVVVKASGLAAGKGVLIPGTLDEAKNALHEVMVARAFGSAGDEVVIEERLTGQEASLLCFADGHTVHPMPAAQDHKRVFEDDLGPNTGGMGAYAPAPVVTPALAARVTADVLQRTVDGMRAEGHPYVGFLYAGLMIDDQGEARVLEFNCRFGDPEAQVLLPLLATDLVDVLDACLAGRLAELTIDWRPGAAATVVAASEGYPGSYPHGRAIQGLDAADGLEGVQVFHAGTRRTEGGWETSGGRVLAVTGTGDDLRAALDRAYAALGFIYFEGMHLRRDIGAKAL